MIRDIFLGTILMAFSIAIVYFVLYFLGYGFIYIFLTKEVKKYYDKAGITAHGMVSIVIIAVIIGLLFLAQSIGEQI